MVQTLESRELDSMGALLVLDSNKFSIGVQLVLDSIVIREGVLLVLDSNTLHMTGSNTALGILLALNSNTLRIGVQVVLDSNVLHKEGLLVLDALHRTGSNNAHGVLVLDSDVFHTGGLLVLEGNTCEARRKEGRKVKGRANSMEWSLCHSRSRLSTVIGAAL